MARGSIRPRPTADGKKIRYRVKWESTWPDGRRRYHSETLPNKKAAEEFLADKLKEVTDGSFVVPTRETVGEFLERWLEASAAGWSESTAYQYRSVVEARIAPHLGTVPLAKLDALMIQSAYAKLLADGYAPGSVNTAHSVLDSALSRAVAWRVLARNPADGVKRPSTVTKPPSTWSETEATAFLEATKGDRFGPMWRLGLDSGMRLGEMLALSWRDVDVQRGVVAVRRTLTRSRSQERGWKIGELAKTASSRRSIPLGASTVTALRSLRAPQAARRLATGSWVDLDLVFDRGDGEWIHPTTVQDAFGRAVKRAKVPRLTPHGMRHTMATLMLAAGVHPKVVQERLGHASIVMTLDRYSHVSISMQADAAALLERLLGDGARPERGQDAG